MNDATNGELLAEYARNRSEAAFAALVSRHLPLVYSTALRFTGNPHHSEEIAQAVFVILARKAGRLRAGTVLSGWLYQTTRLTAANFRKAELRRHRREQEAHMQSTLTQADSSVWEQVAPFLDKAMGRLSEIDRNAIILRFFENKTGREIGDALRLSEAAAHQRVNRALEKLRKIFAKEGVTLTSVLLAAVLSANTARSAPPVLAAVISRGIIHGTAITTSTASLVQVTLKTLNWAQYKIPVGIATATSILSVASLLLIREANISRTSLRELAAPNPAVSLEETAAAAPREPFAETTKLNLDTPVGSLAIRPDGSIVLGASLGGFFIDEQSGMLGYYSRGAICLKPDGALDRSFFCDVGHPGVSDAMRASVGCLAAGRIFVSGFFNSVDGQPRPGYAVLLPNGSVDDSFQPWRGDANAPGRQWYPEGVRPTALLSDGSVGVAVPAVLPSRYWHPTTVYRLGASGEVIPPPTNVLAGVFSRPSGLIVTLGPAGFWARRSIAWSNTEPVPARPPIRYGSELLTGADTPPVADLPFEQWTDAPTASHAATVLQALFEEVPIEMCRYAARLPDGGAILAVCNGVNNGSLHRSGRFMRFDRNWMPDASFTNEFDVDIRGSSLSLKPQPDGRLLVAGIGTLDGEELNGLARLMPDGALDRTFHCETGNSLSDRVMDMAVQSDGRILICGYFSKVNGIECPHIARLNPDGSLDPTFRMPFLTLNQFNDERFKRRRVPVQSLTAVPSVPGATTNSVTNAEAAGPAGVASQTIQILSLQMSGDAAVINYTGQPGQTYILQARDRSDSGPWMNVATNQPGADSAGVFRDADIRDHATRFYRVATP